jgi:SAM-dependent methyltransferase|tara:strand:+ start:375 stop:1604 length:1230 start_codon:yes stop_codon:yes gene_type:complete
MKLKNCRICKGNSLTDYLNLGLMPAADAFIKEEYKYLNDPVYPLEVCLCNDCGISQLNFTVDPKILYQNDYPYESSITKTGRVHWDQFAESVVQRAQLSSDDLVIDIGSNVGVLLGAFQKRGCKVLGIEPSKHIAACANQNGVETINDFISLDLAKKIVSNKGQAPLINITNVFAHINNLEGLMKAVDLLLTKNGMFVIEAPHFLNLIEGLEYDTIYHEHLLYISVKPLNSLFKRFGFEVFDVKEVLIHGGSIRIFVGRNGEHNLTKFVNQVIEKEEKANLFDISRLNTFSKQVHNHKKQLRELLLGIKKTGKTIVAVSAPAKGMTLLNYCKIDSNIIDFLTEKSSLKIGKYSPGAHIPIFSDEKLCEKKIDFALLLAWNFSDEIIENLSDFKNSGGKFIIPIPKPKIV